MVKVTDRYIYAGLIIFAIINYALRALPFIVLRRRQMPPWLAYLSKGLPGAIMAILVVYNLRNTSFTRPPYGIPEIIAIIVTIAVHHWKESMVFTLVVGTGVYVGLLYLLG